MPNFCMGFLFGLFAAVIIQVWFEYLLTSPADDTLAVAEGRRGIDE